MACNYVRDGHCIMLDQDCDNCIVDKEVFEQVTKKAVELRMCEHLGEYLGATRCSCSSNLLTHWFHCNERNQRVSAQKCVNCHEKKRSASKA